MTDIPVFPRDMLSAVFNGNVRMIDAFEVLIQRLTGTVTAVEGATASVTQIAATEFILAAASEALTTGKVLAAGDGITLTMGDSEITISLDGLAVEGGFSATFIVTGATNLVLPLIGTLATIADIYAYIASAANYADDAAAAAGGVAVGRIYRTGSALKVRVA